MQSKRAVRAIMEKSGVGTNELAERLNKPARAVSDRLSSDKSTNLSVDILDEMISVMGYKIVLVPDDVKLKDGWYEVEDSRTVGE